MMERRPAAAAFERVSVLLGIAVKMRSQTVHFTMLKSQRTWPPNNIDILSKDDSRSGNMALLSLFNAQGTC